MALQDMATIREAFTAVRPRCCSTRGNYPAIATHDEELVARTPIAHARGAGDRRLPLRVPDALRPAPEAAGTELVARRLQRARLRALRHPLDPLLLPPPPGAQGERALRAAGTSSAASAGADEAVVYRGPGRSAVEDVPVPEPGPGEMLVRVDACGICPTDLKKIEKGLLPGPRIFGHEIAGTVAGARGGHAGLSRGPARRGAPPRPLRRAASTARAGSTPSAPSTSRTARRPASSRRAAATRSTCWPRDWIVERGHDPDPGRRPPRGGGLRRARQHLPQGGAQGARREGRGGPRGRARGRSACS